MRSGKMQGVSCYVGNPYLAGHLACLLQVGGGGLGEPFVQCGREGISIIPPWGCSRLNVCELPSRFAGPIAFHGIVRQPAAWLEHRCLSIHEPYLTEKHSWHSQLFH
jgi:hypothetical protein